MATDRSASLADRVLDIVFGKKLEGEAAAQACGDALPRWARRTYAVATWTIFLAALALFLWSQGWLPLVHTTIDSIWAGAALGANALVQSGWAWLARRQERRAKARRARLSLP